jgi:hypothetical protein
MKWIVRIEKTPDVEDERDQRIRFEFMPLSESILIQGEAKVKNNEWVVFSSRLHPMEITLEQLQEQMEAVIVEMRKRLVEYENLSKGFTVLKWIALEDESIDDSQPQQLD